MASPTAPLSTQGYRGTRDFFPEDQRLRNFIYQKIREVFLSFGYEEYDGPLLEPIELYAAKSSEEIVRDQLYTLVDRGERTLALRPEMTPTLARMIASKYQEMPRPIRWFSLPTCLRFERPQRGRLREFGQLNVDVFGGLPLDEDVEVLLTAAQVLCSVGGTYDQFQILVNHRGLVEGYLEHVLGVERGSTQMLAIFRTMDKWDKLSPEAKQEELENAALTTPQKKDFEHFLVSSLREIAQRVQDVPALLGYVQDMQERIHLVQALTKESCIRFSPGIMRGFNYYTGFVFEVFDTHPDNRRALFGGGRYDNLVSAFGVDPLPGIGYGMGDVALLNFMEVHGLTPSLQKTVDVCVVRFRAEDRLESFLLGQKLRNLGLRVETTLTLAKFAKQLQNANRILAKAVVFRGEDEMKTNTFCVKWLAQGTQEHFSYDDFGFQDFLQKLGA